MKNKTTPFIIIVFILILLISIVYYIKNEVINTENNIKYDNSTELFNNDSLHIDSLIYKIDSISLNYDLDSSMIETLIDSMYYVVIGSFKIETNALNFNELNKHSHIIINNGFNMVYIYASSDLNDAIYIRNINKEKYDGIWILKN